MRPRFRIYREHKQGLTNLICQQQQDPQNNAKDTLMAITDEECEPSYNGTEIARWNNHQLNLLASNHVKPKKKKRKLRMMQDRSTCSENSFHQKDGSLFHSGMGSSIKRQINKPQLPLKQKILNEQQFTSFEQKEKGRTRQQVKLDIIHSKHQIAPALLRRKVVTQHCDDVLKPRIEAQQYQKIRRRGLYTLQIQNQDQSRILRQLSHTRDKCFFLSEPQNNYKIKMRGNSIHQLFSK